MLFEIMNDKTMKAITKKVCRAVSDGLTGNGNGSAADQLQQDEELVLIPEHKTKTIEAAKAARRKYYREYRKKNPEKVKESQKRWKEKNREKVRKQQNEWRRNNPDKVRKINERYWEKKGRQALEAAAGKEV